MNSKIVIGTRGSKLAVWQAELVKARLLEIFPGLEVSLKLIKTSGDKILDTPLAKIGGKGLFVKEIEEALLRGDADIAVHSMKDVPSELPDGLRIAAVMKREDPRDALVTAKDIHLSLTSKSLDKREISDLSLIPKGAVIGTSSLRRSCQLRRGRPDIKIVSLRGNIDTRLRKLDSGDFHAIALAAAGLKRLGLENRITAFLSRELCLPAAAQGAIGIEIRTDSELSRVIELLDDPSSHLCVKAERQFLKKLGGGCQAPIAAHARLTSYTISDSSLMIIEGLVANIEGSQFITHSIEGRPSQAEFLGEKLADIILNKGAKAILDRIYGGQEKQDVK